MDNFKQQIQQRKRARIDIRTTIANHDNWRLFAKQHDVSLSAVIELAMAQFLERYGQPTE